MDIIKLYVILVVALQCDAVSIWRQLVHIARRRLESQRGMSVMRPTRRFGFTGPNSVILGSPSLPSHLPQAEPILPGHTLIKPSMGMLKSAVKFPHREQEDGAGVYGHIDNLGIRYDGTNDRVMYTRFRRMPTRRNLDLIMPYQPEPWYHPKQRKSHKKLRHHKSQLSNTLDQYTSGDNHKTHFKKLHKSKKNLKNFGTLHPKYLEAETAQGYPLTLLLREVEPSRRDDDQNQELGDKESTSRPANGIPLEEIIRNGESISETEDNNSISKWFWDTKDYYNHIKINQDAPDHNDLLPTDAFDNVQNWWFYHQMDFKDFEDRRLMY